MNPVARRKLIDPVQTGELNVLLTLLPDPADRPLPTDEEIDAAESVDPDLDAAVRAHVEPSLGPSSSTTLFDTAVTVPINVGLTEPADDRAWGACFTIGASARAMPTADADRPDTSAFVELFLRLPASAFRYWDGVVLEPFEFPFDPVVEALGEMSRLPHDRRVCYRAPQIVATPAR